jgi:hypothetical protein
VLFAACTAVSIGRIAEPSKPTPVLIKVTMIVLGIGAAILWIISLFSGGSSSRRSGYYDDDRYYGSSRSAYDSGYTETTTTTTSGPPKPPGMGLVWAIVSTICFGAVYATCLIVMLWLVGDFGAPGVPKAPGNKVATKQQQQAPRPPPPPTPAPQPPPPPANDITSTPTLDAAIAFAKPDLSDNRHTPSPGAKLLAKWGALKMRFVDVAVATNETTMQLAVADPMKAVGKRLCAAGTIARFDKATVDGTDLVTARVTVARDALEVYAVGPVGALAVNKAARFCGVVTGRLDVAGKPSTFAVGMFEVK